MSDFRKRLEIFLGKHGLAYQIEQLTPDASTREYYRLISKEESKIACVYPLDSFGCAQLDACTDVTDVFLSAGLPVARIEMADKESGVIIHEDFGDNILRNVMLDSPPTERERLLDRALRLIARIQAATPKAFEVNSICSRLKFDEEKLVWELNFYRKHYFESLKKSPLPDDLNSTVTAEFIELARELESKASILCHRDFHAANLMVGSDGHLKIIDHQDARMGSLAYDPVSLLLDRVTEIPDATWLESKKRLFLSFREDQGLPVVPYDEFNYEFRLMTVQRCLKAIGTFSNQMANRGKPEYEQYIRPMYEIVLNACRKLDRFPALQKVISSEIS
jgi:hypothetical protein